MPPTETMRPGPKWELGGRVAIATYRPPVTAPTVFFGVGLGLALAAFLWWLGWTWLGGVALVAVALAVGACCYLPLDHLAVGDGWAANGPPERPLLVEAVDVRAITMPDLMTLGAPVIKLDAGHRVVRLDVNALAERADLIAPVLALVGLALAGGATIDADADAALQALRRRQHPQGRIGAGPATGSDPGCGLEGAG